PRRLVEKSHWGIADQYEPARGPASLTAREASNQRVGLRGQAELIENRLDPRPDIGAPIETQVCRIAKGLARGQPIVDALPLGHIAERLHGRCSRLLIPRGATGTRPCDAG